MKNSHNPADRLDGYLHTEQGRSDSLFVIDEYPWSQDCNPAYIRFLANHVGAFYSTILDQPRIESLCTDTLFPKIIELGDFDLILVPLMAGAVLVEPLKRQFGDKTPVVPLPLSRHPGVGFLRQSRNDRQHQLARYGAYATSFSARLATWAASQPRPQRHIRVLLVDQTHHEGRVLTIAMKILSAILPDWRVDFAVATLVNEIGENIHLTPDGTVKLAVPAVWALESHVDTRSSSHLYYVLGSLRGAWADEPVTGAPDTFALWDRTDHAHSHAFSLYPTPRLYRHERAALDGPEEDWLEELWQEWHVTGSVPKSDAETQRLLAFETPLRAGLAR